MNSQIGLIIQFVGVSLIAMLFVFLTASLKSGALRYWKTAWLALACALFCLSVAFASEAIAKPFFALYYTGEYAFAYFLIAGCRNYASGAKLTARSWLMLIPATATAVLLAFPFGDLMKFLMFIHLFLRRVSSSLFSL